ncbi:MAG: radical SAM protein [Prevotellaceae bacterium]|jgi:wyosine [tRNA(Phe)-imidazoG37] synthetase (radical SAM superfamily)|nr:radical SAM protein [Prevotellaceae bacterium]
MLFNEIVFGPIHSRRLGVSLGINLLPTGNKLCNFNCIYCECGWNTKGDDKKRFNLRNDVKNALEEKLKSLQAEEKYPDSITFSGNGEPTMHPEFAEIVDDTIALRNKYAPLAKISVLSNATMIAKANVIAALLKIDNAILKLDSGINETAILIDKPQFGYSIDKIIEYMQAFKNRMILQTMFLRGTYEGKYIDNTTETEINAWIDAVQKISPREIMIYTIDRETPASDLQKINSDDLEKIANRARKLGYKVQVAK